MVGISLPQSGTIVEQVYSMEISISLAKRFWGRRKVDYLGHQVSLAEFEENPKDLGSLVNIPFPRSLRSMQSFLGSLNYYSRFIEDFHCAHQYRTNYEKPISIKTDQRMTIREQ